MTTPRLEVIGLAKNFGDHTVLQDISFSLGAGESLAIIGRSGSGKSTLLKCLSLIDLPDRGTVALDGDVYVKGGRVLFQPWEVRRSVGIVFQDFNLFPNMTVRQNIALALVQNKGITSAAANAKSATTARALKIEDLLDRYPHEISGGEAQRCALARAIVLEPRVFLLDEITSALDPLTILDVVDAIRALRSTEGNSDLAVVFVTHLMHFAETFADRIAFIYEGKIHEVLPASEFFSSAAKTATRAFIDANRRAFP